LENQRLAAIFIAMIAALLVILAGRSCARSIENANKETTNGYSISKNTVGSDDNTGGKKSDGDATYETASFTNNGIEYVTDILGRVVGTNIVTEDTSQEFETETGKEYVTDMLGRVVEEKDVIVTVPAGAKPDPHVEYVTDILGRVVETKYVDENNDEVTTQASSKKNPLEEYREKHSEYYKPTESDKTEKEPLSAPSTIHIKIG